MGGWSFGVGKKEGIFFEVKKITYMETIQSLLKSCMSFGSLKESRRVILKKNWGDKFYCEIWGNTA